MGTLPAPPAPLPSSEEQRIKRRARTVFLVVAGILAVAGLTAVLFIGVSLYSLFDLGNSSPQPDDPLVSRFQGNREAFRELLLLAWKDDGREPGGRRVKEVAERPQLGARERRRYRQLRRQLGIESSCSTTERQTSPRLRGASCHPAGSRAIRGGVMPIATRG